MQALQSIILLGKGMQLRGENCKLFISPQEGYYLISGEKIANHSSLPSPVTQLLQSAVAISENLGNLPPLSRGRIPPSPSQEL
jgi:hypothetical protein